MRCGVDEIGGFVASAAMRNGREIGGIGFEEKSRESYRGQSFAKAGVLECDDAVDSEIEVGDFTDGFNIGNGATEAMHHPTQARNAADYFERLRESLTTVDDHGKVKIHSPAEL